MRYIVKGLILGPSLGTWDQSLRHLEGDTVFGGVLFTNLFLPFGMNPSGKTNSCISCKLKSTRFQQLREAFPYPSTPRFLIFDRDAKFGAEVPIAVRSMPVNAVRTSVQSPWQNGIAERWIGPVGKSCWTTSSQ